MQHLIIIDISSHSNPHPAKFPKVLEEKEGEKEGEKEEEEERLNTWLNCSKIGSLRLLILLLSNIPVRAFNIELLLLVPGEVGVTP